MDYKTIYITVNNRRFYYKHLEQNYFSNNTFETES